MFRPAPQGALALAVGLLGCSSSPAPTSASSSPSSVVAEREPSRSVGPAYTEIDLSDRYGCALRRDGAVACWGDDPAVALGLRPSTKHWTEASVVEGLGSARSIAVNDHESCVVLEAESSVSCWGEGPLHAITGLSDVVELESAGSTTCARTRGQEVHCWDPGEAEPELRFRGAVDLGVGVSKTCALDEDGGVWCWPEDLRIVGAPTRLASQRVATVADAVEVFASQALCVRTRTGEVQCASLADSPPGEGYQPKPVAALEPVAVYARAREHGCALLGGGFVRCHGANGWAQLGDGSSTPREDASPVPLEQVANAIAVSRRLSCALTDERAWCWGTPRSQPPELDELEPHVVMRDAVALVSDHHFSCASKADGKPICWGSFGAGTLDADPGGIVAAAEPAPMQLNIGPITALLNGCFLGRSGELRCGALISARETVGSGQFVWNFDALDIEAVARGSVDCLVEGGRLSCQNRAGNRQALAVPSLQRVTAVQNSKSQYCAIHAGGRASCFFARPEHPVPVLGALVEVALPDPARSLFTRRDQTCAVTKNGEVWCWQLEGTDVSSVHGLTALALPPAQDAVAFAGHTCASTPDGRVACLRDQGEQELRWLELEDVIELVGGAEHLCARDAAGTVTCLGSNDVGQLGTLPPGFMAEPTRIELPRTSIYAVE